MILKLLFINIYFFILSASNFNHAFSGGVLNGNFTQDRITIISHHNAAHWIHQHLQHRLWTQTCPNNIGNLLQNHNSIQILL